MKTDRLDYAKDLNPPYTPNKHRTAKEGHRFDEEHVGIKAPNPQQLRARHDKGHPPKSSNDKEKITSTNSDGRCLTEKRQNDLKTQPNNHKRRIQTAQQSHHSVDGILQTTSIPGGMDTAQRPGSPGQD